MELKRTILLAIGVAACVALAAVASTQRATPGLVFSGVDVPTKMAQKVKAIASSSVRWRGRKIPISLGTLALAGEDHGGTAFAQLYGPDGSVVEDPDGTPHICNDLDGVTLLQTEGALWHIAQGECRAGVLQLSRVEQDAETGRLTLGPTGAIDLSPVGGGSLFCAAEDTPWNTHLAAEEYDADASTVLPNGTLSTDHQGYNSMGIAHGGTLEGVDPYNFGWIDEVEILDAEGKTLVSKRTAMGRFSHEQARVMPDRRTVYLSDDGRNGGFFVFVADVAGDLSVGQLYASRWDPGPEGALATLTWISLGRASEAQIAPWLAREVPFEELFRRGERVDGACPKGFVSVNTSWKDECLNVQSGADVAASRMETRRYAAMQGATTELSKAEGMAFDPTNKRLYLALARVERGMTAASEEWDFGGPDHLQWAENPCGLVVGMELGEAVDSTGVAIDSLYVAGEVNLVLEGAVRSYTGGLKHNTCDLDSIAGPDNLEFIPEAGVLLVAEDTSAHDNNALWAFDTQRGSLTRVLTVPLGGEVAGLQWYPDIGGWGYITVSIQKPFSTRGDPWWVGEAEGDPRSWTGWLGPFPRL